MMKSDLFLGPPRDLTDEELKALRTVRSGTRISGNIRTRLELRDLIQEGLNGWKLTTAGELRLSAGK